VTNITDEAMEVRLLCSANTPEKAWSLRFRLTEQMMARLRGLEADHHLPKQRLVIERSAGRERSTNGRVTGQATEHDRASDGGEAEQAGA
jgi:hypothetical protein